jgi:hypothetical protein
MVSPLPLKQLLLETFEIRYLVVHGFFKFAAQLGIVNFLADEANEIVESGFWQAVKGRP